MAGEAKTDAFLLSTATVMIGPTSALFDLNPAAHSIGLVKNFQIEASPTYTELTQGVKNQIVFSVLTQNPIKCSMEVFEMTSKNLAYGLGLDGSSLSAISTTDVLSTSMAAADTTATIASGSDLSAVYAAGKWVVIQPVSGNDKIHLTTIASTAYAGAVQTVTLDHGVPTGMSFASGDKISIINRVNVGSKAEQPFLSAKVTGILPKNNEPIVILIPKIRIVKGFQLAFHSDAFQNLPYEFTPYELVSTDDNYAVFADLGPAAVFSKT